jgi:hypothetical protein
MTTFQNRAKFPVDRSSGCQITEDSGEYSIVLTMTATTASVLAMMEEDWNNPGELPALVRPPSPAHFRRLASPRKPFVFQALSGRQPDQTPTRSG